MSRPGSVRLRSALGSSSTTTKGDSKSSPADPTSAMGSSGYSFPETAGAVKSTSRSSNRRTLNNNNNNNNVIHSNNNSNGPNGPSGLLVNGTASISTNSSGNQIHNNTNHSTSLTSTSTRSQSTRSSVKDKVLPIPPLPSITSSSAMEIDDDDVVNTQQQSESTAALESRLGSSGDDDKQLVPSSTGLNVTSGVVVSDPSSSTNQSNVSPNTSFPTSLFDAVNAAMEVEVDGPEDSTSPTSSEAESSASSDSDDSSEMDEVNCERKKVMGQEDMHDLEKQFTYLREFLYKERLCSVDEKLEEVRSGRSKEYIGPVEKLQENMSVRIEITANLRELRLKNLQHKTDAEEIGSLQNYESQKQLLYDSIKSDLADKIRRLEEDRNNDFTSELWLDAALKRKNKKSVDIFGEKKKKPVVVSGPYVVYMLNDVDIVEDWTIIKKALSAPKRKYVDPVVF